MPGVFPTNEPVALLQFGNHVAVTDIGANERDRQIRKGQFETKIAHQRTDDATLQLATLMQIAGNDKQQVVTINNGAGVIDHQYPITITVEGDTQVRMLSQNGGLQWPHMRGTAVIVDVQPIRLGR